MVKAISIAADGANAAARDLLKSLLAAGKVRAVTTLVEAGPAGEVNYQLVADEAILDRATPLYPFMPANAGGVLSHLTLSAGFEEPVAAFLRPCELRAFVELGKLNQINTDNLLIISTTCGGVYPLDAVLDGGLADKLPAYWEALAKGDVPEGLRPTCSACEHFAPFGADVVVAAVGAGGAVTVVANTPRGEEALEGLEGAEAEATAETAGVKALRTKREAARAELFASEPLAAPGLEGLVALFGRCVGCRSCRSVCPICCCEVCYFDSATTEPTARTFEVHLKRKAGTRVPPDTLLFHLGRMTHMSASCVGCGMCADACPVYIPVATLFAKVGGEAQELFEYIPGKDAEEELPLKRFEEEELTEIGEERFG
ncbi:MAG: Coenzyme F420 hydrogenase/dehydrogenase, beta subunit C-terminal domain [Candidatus Zixiibacteriota bacterium]